MIYALYALFFLSCIVLCGSVLLQPGKTDAGALFTSNISSSALAPRGTTTILSKITIVAAACFMLTALFLSMPALNGNVSVLNANPDAPADAPVANTNANTDANTAANTANPTTDNSNGALIQTPATEQVEQQAANAAAANAVPANAAVTAPADAANKPVAPAANK